MNKLITVLSILIVSITLFNVYKVHDINTKLDNYLVELNTEPELIFIEDIQYDTVYVDRYEKVLLPIITKDTITDTITVFTDSVYVQLPISKYEYSDTLQETAFSFDLSGYNCKVDKLYLQNLKICPEPQKQPKKWGIGVQLGIGGCKDGFSPYIGVGLNYNIFSF